MAKYKHTDAENGQDLFLRVNLKEQLLPGTFEYMLDDLIGGKIDISVFDKNYKNDKTGAPAIPPAAPIKLILYGYSKGRNSSRGIAELSRNNITAKALTGNLEPHWTSIADFISGNHEAFKEIFKEVPAYSNELGLIGGEIHGAVLDNRNQIIVSAEAAGNANESGYFADMLDDTMNNLNIKKEEAGKKRKRRILGDKNYFGEENLRSAEERGFEAMILDSQYKKRLGKNGEVYYEAADFKYDREQECFICPGGKELVYKGTMRIGGRKWGKRIRRI
jgi:hypothetical protein